MKQKSQNFTEKETKILTLQKKNISQDSTECHKMISSKKLKVSITKISFSKFN